jgi:CheY-like chemotaxis protein
MTKILVVDDNTASRELLRAVLKAPDRLMLEAQHGKEALDVISQEEPDLVLLDIELPLLDGYGVLDRLRQNPRFARLPVIAVTANAMPGTRERAIARGFDAYITKPIKAAQVREQVTQILRSGTDRI